MITNVQSAVAKYFNTGPRSLTVVLKLDEPTANFAVAALRDQSCIRREESIKRVIPPPAPTTVAPSDVMAACPAVA